MSYLAGNSERCAIDLSINLILTGRDSDKNIEQRQASGGKMFVVCDNRSCMRNIHSEINYCLGNRSLVIFLTNLADLNAGKRGEGDSVWLKARNRG